MEDTATITAPAADGKIVCHIDNARVHAIQTHIAKNHPEWTIERYQASYPDAPILSEHAKTILAKNAKAREEAAAAAGVSAAPAASTAGMQIGYAQFHHLFDLGNAKAAMNSAGNPINIKVMENHNDEDVNYLPDIDPAYVFNIDLLKKVVIGFELGMPIYLWGYHGTGKTTILQQAAARTKRPFIRVQHTINMQESDILGQWTVKDGSTIFQLGPLPMAMINGWVYCADEYDFAMPSVSAVYQPVLEGQALLIKDAPPQFRKITPHANFRFVATGNTNGVGDETGLYQGTLVQNAANYSRFKITDEVTYMEAKIEESILISKTSIDRPSAAKVVKFANQIREAFADGKISMTVSPRELLSACELAIVYGANLQPNFVQGLELAFANRLSRVDKKTVQELMQRHFTK